MFTDQLTSKCDYPQTVPKTEQNVVLVSLSETVLLLYSSVLLLYSTVRNFVLHSHRQLFHAQLTPLTTKRKIIIW